MTKRFLISIGVFIATSIVFIVATRPEPEQPIATVPPTSPSAPSSVQASTTRVELATTTPEAITNGAASIIIEKSLPSSPTADIFVNSSTWATFTDPEDFYSIQYPNLGSLVVKYWPVPLKTALGWKGKGNFDVSIWTFDPEHGLHLAEWLKKMRGIDTSSSSKDIQQCRVNGMDCVLVFSHGGYVIAYLEQDFFEEPLIHEIDFVSYTSEYEYPPFWKTMLQTFQQLPWKE